jgi:hypothetical protein
MIGLMEKNGLKLSAKLCDELSKLGSRVYSVRPLLASLVINRTPNRTKNIGFAKNKGVFPHEF